MRTPVAAGGDGAAQVAALATALGSPLAARVAANRGITSADALDIRLSRLADPRSLPGCMDAARLLADHARRGGRVAVVGDYDADGATATALVCDALARLGLGDACYVLPERRQDGYGLKPALVQRAVAQGASLLLTVDNGITSLDGVAAARAAGLDVIVTDHHLPGPRLPDANVIVDPVLAARAPALALAGVGVAFYVMLALRGVLRERGAFAAGAEPSLAPLLDLVALGTVADVVPFDHNNRVLVAAGLARMRSGRMRPGLVALAEVAGVRAADIDEQVLAFTLAPRLNAVGRLARIDAGVRLLLAPGVEAALPLARELDAVNAERRSLDRQTTAEALALAAAQRQHRAVVVARSTWHAGVVGIVAGRLREVLGRPAFAFAPAAGGFLQGSGRSLPGVHLRDVLAAIEARHPGLLHQFGGHAMAAGVTLAAPRLGRFAAALETTLSRLLPDGASGHVVDVDGSVDVDALRVGTAQALSALAPFGPGFPVPEFCDCFEVVDEQRYRGGLSRLVVQRGGRMFDAIARQQAPIGRGARRFVYRLALSAGRGRPTLQLDIRHVVADATPRDAVAQAAASADALPP